MERRGLAFTAGLATLLVGGVALVAVVGWVGAEPPHSGETRDLRQDTAPSRSAPMDPTAVDDARPSALPLRLVGTVAHRDSSLAWAAVEDLETGRHLAVRIGDVLQERALVRGIEAERLLLEVDGRVETLRLGHRAPRGPTLGAPRGGEPAIAWHDSPEGARDPDTRRLGAGRYSISQEAAERLLGAPERWMRSPELRVLPRAEDGALVGLQLNAIRPGSLPARVGLRNGDTITEIDGLPVGEALGAEDTLREAASRGAFEITLSQRDGSERRIRYEMH